MAEGLHSFVVVLGLDNKAQQMQTTAMIDIWTPSATGWPGQVREFPLQAFPPSPPSKWPILAAITSLSKEIVHPSARFTSKSTSTSSEMKKLVVKKGTQSEVSAKSVPSWVPPQFPVGQDFLSNGTQCTQKNRKTFWREKSKKDD